MALASRRDAGALDERVEAIPRDRPGQTKDHG